MRTRPARLLIAFAPRLFVAFAAFVTLSGAKNLSSHPVPSLCHSALAAAHPAVAPFAFVILSEAKNLSSHPESSVCHFAFGTVPAAVPQRARAPEPKSYKISKSYTTLSFTATKWMVFKEEGLFQDYSGTITYDAENPAASSIDVSVESASLDTRNKTRDDVLRSDDFFDVKKYPTLSFRSTAVASTDANDLTVTGDLTIHGVAKRIAVPVHVIGARLMPGIGDFAGFETTFTLDRRDYGVLGTRWSGNSMAIDPTITIHLIIGGVKP